MANIDGVLGSSINVESAKCGLNTQGRSGDGIYSWRTPYPIH